MSYPKAAVRLPHVWGEGSVTASVFGYHPTAQVLWVEVPLPRKKGELPTYGRFEVPLSDVRWVNTEAAGRYNLHDAPVIGDGYGAAEKLAAYQAERTEDGSDREAEAGQKDCVPR